MSHFAKIIGGIVQSVIVAEQETIDRGEQGDPNTWVQTSYNTRGGIHYQPNSDTPSEDQSKALRKNYAGIGYTYDSERDAFIPPQPYLSWTLNEQTCLWDPPIPHPTYPYTFEDGSVIQYKHISWDEDQLNWKLITKNDIVYYWNNNNQTWIQN